MFVAYLIGMALAGLWSVAATPEPPACGRLDDSLRQLAEAVDPDAFARERGLALFDGQVRIVVELLPDAALKLDAPILVEAQYETFVQGLVRPEDLCYLAEDPAISVVRLPFPRMPDRATP